MFEGGYKNYKIGPAMRVFFFDIGTMTRTGVGSTGFGITHWLLYVSAVLFYLVAMTDPCSGLIVSRILGGKKNQEVTQANGWRLKEK
jgi:hypothetical protein